MSKKKVTSKPDPKKGQQHAQNMADVGLCAGSQYPSEHIDTAMCTICGARVRITQRGSFVKHKAAFGAVATKDVPLVYEAKPTKPVTTPTGYCTGSQGHAPVSRTASGRVRTDLCATTAACPTCGKRVRITKRGRYAGHKPASGAVAMAKQYGYPELLVDVAGSFHHTPCPANFATLYEQVMEHSGERVRIARMTRNADKERETLRVARVDYGKAMMHLHDACAERDQARAERDQARAELAASDLIGWAYGPRCTTD